jgi:hypothetical protein
LIAPHEMNVSIDSRTGIAQWLSPTNIRERTAKRIHVRVTDSTPPFLSDTEPVIVSVVPLHIHALNFGGDGLWVAWDAISGQRYQLQVATNMTFPDWRDVSDSIIAVDGNGGPLNSRSNDSQSYYRVKLLP